MIVQAALQEDADVVGLSILSGAHMELFPAIIQQLKAQGLKDVIIIARWIVPEEDRPELAKMGITGIFGPGTPTQEIAEFIRKAVAQRVGRSSH